MSAPSQQLTGLYRRFADGAVDRREFMRQAAALGVAGVAASALAPLTSGPAAAAGLAAQAGAAGAGAKIALDVAEWSYMWVNVKRAETARGAFVGGQQMYVEYMIPAQVRHPFPVVLVHGGGGQGTDWMGTPDGRPGWFQDLVQEGYKVYVVDRPGTGARRCTPTCTARFHRRRWFSKAWRGASRPRARTRLSSRISIRRTTRSGPVPATSDRRTSTSCARAWAAATCVTPQAGPAGGGRQGGTWRRGGSQVAQGAARRRGRHRRPTRCQVRTTCSTWPGGRPVRICSTRSARRSS